MIAIGYYKINIIIQICYCQFESEAATYTIKIIILYAHQRIFPCTYKKLFIFLVLFKKLLFNPFLEKINIMYANRIPVC